MRFKGLDLNLLVVLDTLLSERNVSRAAEKLHLSQSAASGSLARLREYFGDELLVASGRRLVLTPRALELAASVHGVLAQVENRIMTPAAFDPSTSTRRIRIMASDYISIACLSDALAAISIQAPQMSFEILAVDDAPAEALERGAVDLLIMPEVYVSKSHPHEVLFEENYVCVLSAGNTQVGETLSFEDYLRLRHVVVQFGAKRRPTFEDWFLDRFGNARSVDVVASSYSVVPFLVAGTERVATLHERLGRRYAAYLGLRLEPPPLAIPNIVEVAQWHTMNAGDACLMWVKDEIGRSVASAARIVEHDGAASAPYEPAKTLAPAPVGEDQ